MKLPLPTLLTLLLFGCGTEPAPASTPTPEPTPIEALNQLDTRTPVPLQPMMAWHQKQNMQAHLVAIQKLTDALSREDWEGVGAAVLPIAPSPQMQMQCEHMGAGADGFTARALDFHERAAKIGLAAEQHDVSAVLAATSHTLEACTGCHATYRQEVMDAESWQGITGQKLEHHAPE